MLVIRILRGSVVSQIAAGECQGTASAVPKRLKREGGFSR
jgi:hypothetical protein